MGALDGLCKLVLKLVAVGCGRRGGRDRAGMHLFFMSFEEVAERGGVSVTWARDGRRWHRGSVPAVPDGRKRRSPAAKRVVADGTLVGAVAGV